MLAKLAVLATIAIALAPAPSAFAPHIGPVIEGATRREAVAPRFGRDGRVAGLLSFGDEIAPRAGGGVRLRHHGTTAALVGADDSVRLEVIASNESSRPFVGECVDFALVPDPASGGLRAKRLRATPVVLGTRERSWWSTSYRLPASWRERHAGAVVAVASVMLESNGAVASTAIRKVEIAPETIGVARDAIERH